MLVTAFASAFKATTCSEPPFLRPVSFGEGRFVGQTWSRGHVGFALKLTSTLLAPVYSGSPPTTPAISSQPPLQIPLPLPKAQACPTPSWTLGPGPSSAFSCLLGDCIHPGVDCVLFAGGAQVVTCGLGLSRLQLPVGVPLERWPLHH